MNNKIKIVLSIIVISFLTSFLSVFITIKFIMKPNQNTCSDTNNDDIKLGDTTPSFDSSNVLYDNSTSGINSNRVQGAIDELYACASNFTAYDTRLQGVETKVGSTTLNTTSQDLSGAVNEINSRNSNQTISVTLNSTYVSAGTLSCVIKNGWAYVSGAGIIFNQSGNSITIASGLPKPKYQAVFTMVGSNSSNSGLIASSADLGWIAASSTSMSVHLGSTYSLQHWFSFSYPVE